MKTKTISIPISDLQTTTLFQKMNVKKIKSALTALGAKEKYYEKNETVLFAGSKTYALLSDEPMLVDVIANEDTAILLLRIGSLKELADYLNVERSALSKELGKMQRKGLVKTRKRHFQLSYRFPPQ